MFNRPLSLLKTMFVAAAVAVGVVVHAWAKEATIYRDCFRIEPGQIPHLVCTVDELNGIDYAVDRYASNDWVVVIQGWGMDDARIKKAKPGEHLPDDNDMSNGVDEVTGTAQPFVFEFCNWYRNGAVGSKTWYGYVSIALDENAQLVILESAICDQQNVLTVMGGDSHLVVDNSGRFIEFSQNPDIRFRATQHSPQKWAFWPINPGGRVFVAEGVLDEAVCDETFSNRLASIRVEAENDASTADPAFRIYIGGILAVSAEGTRIAAPPMTYMFGLAGHYQLGTEGLYRAEYGYDCARGYNGFSVDLTNYMMSNGVFKIAFPEWILDKDCGFFSVTIKPYGDH